MIDYHVHTSRCCHAGGTMEEYLAEAEKKQLVEIGFADHFPLGLLGFSPANQVTMQPEELPDYIDDVNRLKNLSNNIGVSLGLEVDYLPGTVEKLAGALENFRFDYIIGSIHFIGDWDFTHPAQAAKYSDMDIDELYNRYFELIGDACRCGLFDIIGHIDVVKKFGYRPGKDLDGTWNETARVLLETGTAIELNTAGRDAPVGEYYPHRRFLEICSAAGVPVTLGSDAHDPSQVGRYFPDALALLKKSGYRELTLFKQRRKITIPLGSL